MLTYDISSNFYKSEYVLPIVAEHCIERNLMIKLKEILQMPAFKDFKVIAGHEGIGRDISTVSVMDAPDIYKWMKGGEFLITSGYAVKDQPDYLKSLIMNLETWGASAFGIKIERFIHEFPQEALAEADRLGFPIVAIPYEFAFTDVINPVLREVIDNQSRKMMYTEGIHEAFTGMVLRDEDIPVILDYLKQQIHCEVAVADTFFSKVYFSKDTAENDDIYRKLDNVFDSSRNTNAEIERYHHYRLYINDEEYGYIITGKRLGDYDEFFEDYYKIAIEQAGTIVILKIQKQIATVQIEADYREQFVQDMLFRNIGSKEEIINRAMIYNWNLYSGGIVVIVDVDHFKLQYLERLDQERNRLLEDTMRKVLLVSKRIIRRYYQNFIYSKLSDQIVFIVTDGFEDKVFFVKQLKEILEEVREEIKKTVSFTVTIGAGNYKKDIGQIHNSFEEAKKAISISRNMKRENVITVYDELGAFKLLSLVSNCEEALEFQEQYIWKLEEYDKRYHTEMLNTLIMLVSCGWNLKETSGKLYIHYNSMKYRYQKICKILDIDFQNQDQKLNLELALKLYQINMKM